MTSPLRLLAGAVLASAMLAGSASAAVIFSSATDFQLSGTSDTISFNIDATNFENLMVHFVQTVTSNAEACGTVNGDCIMVSADSTQIDGGIPGLGLAVALFPAQTPIDLSVPGSFDDTTWTLTFDWSSSTSGENYFFNQLSVTGDEIPPTTGVSEPGTLALMGLGLAGLGFARRRRKS